jgi:hypothetical protein
MLLSSRVDFHFQQVISRHDTFGDKALALLQAQCAYISFTDKHHFNHLFTNLRIGFEETSTRFLHRFTIARTQSEQADNFTPTFKSSIIF